MTGDEELPEETAAFEGTAVEEAEAEALEVTKYLVFQLGSEEYGVELTQIQEIKAWETVTPVPNQPAHVLGLTNLRGLIVPVVDLRLRFGVGEAGYHERTAVIMFRINDRVAGAVVDSVADVVGLGEDQIEPAPESSSGIRAQYLVGIASVEGRMVALVDAERLLASPEMGIADTEEREEG